MRVVPDIKKKKKRKKKEIHLTQPSDIKLIGVRRRININDF